MAPVDIPEWLRDVPVPSAEEYEALNRQGTVRMLEADAVTTQLIEQLAAGAVKSGPQHR